MALWRGDAVESLHRGLVTVMDSSGRLRGSVGDPATFINLRSAAKPFQAAAVVQSGAVDAFDVTSEELAVMAGSHAGQAQHVRAVRSLLARAKTSEDALVCGPPVHMCSGKHAGMILLARHLGAAVEGYERPDHPVQHYIAAFVTKLLKAGAGVHDAPGSLDGLGGLEGPSSSLHSVHSARISGPAATASCFAGTDGCGVPVLRLKAEQVALLFACLAAGVHPALARVRDAMWAHPEMVAGRSRLDTRLLCAAPGSVVGKGGAEGVQGLGLREGADGARALGWAIKIEDGSSRPLPALIRACLEACGLDIPSEALEQTSPRDEWTGRSLAAPVVHVLIDGRALVRSEVRETRSGGGGPSVVLDGERLELVIGHGDEKELVRFLREEWPLSDEEVFGRPTEWIADPFALILKQKRKVLGVLKGHFLGGMASIDEFIVGHEYRGQGLGARMLVRFEEEAQRRGCRRVVLRSVKGGRAECFYRRHGYVTECVQLDYEFGEDFIRMAHVLGSRATEG